jgi:hypothetical protein
LQILPPEQFKILPAEQLQILPPGKFQILTPEQLQILPPKQLQILPPEQLQILPPERSYECRFQKYENKKISLQCKFPGLLVCSCNKNGLELTVLLCNSLST